MKIINTLEYFGVRLTGKGLIGVMFLGFLSLFETLEAIMKIDKINPSKEQLAALMAYPPDTPLVMVNIIKYRNQTDTGEQGKDVYQRYIKNVMPFLQKAGAKLVWRGNVVQTFIGNPEGQPDLILLVEYPSVTHFFGMIGDPEYHQISKDRTMALEYGGLLACQPD